MVNQKKSERTGSTNIPGIAYEVSKFAGERDHSKKKVLLEKGLASRV